MVTTYTTGLEWCVSKGSHVGVPEALELTRNSVREASCHEHRA